ncbi:MAG: molybdopterin molybdotransferase MoeA [Thermoplasmata archaeon]
MRPFKHLIALEKAIDIAIGAVRQVNRVEEVPLWQAVGRVLTGDIVAPLDVPAFDKAAMDGFALRSEDTRGGATEEVKLRVLAKSHAGEPYGGVVGAGECVEVATGSSVPQGCDSVIEVEAVELGGSEISLSKEVVPGRNVSPRGEDIRKGDKLVLEGTTLAPGHLGAISALGLVNVEVFERPSVAIFATGREVRRSGPLGPGEVYDVNSYTLAGLIQENGGAVRIFDPVPDEFDEIKTAVAQARKHDMVVLSGSSSVGERDFLRDAAASLGEVLFHGVAAKPGKPLLLAQVGNGLVFGMPGFPASCLLVAYHVLLPVLRKMARLPTDLGKASFILGEDMPVKDDKTQLVTVHIEAGRAYRAFRKAGSITSVSRGEGYVVIPDGQKLNEGEFVEVILF